MTTHEYVYGYTLWGSHPSYSDGMPLKITSGTLQHCHAAKTTRQGDGGWTTLVIAKSGQRPWFPGDPS